MSDADGRIIPLVEDDQGEGVKDFVDDMDDYVKHWKDVLKPQDNNPIFLSPLRAFLQNRDKE